MHAAPLSHPLWSVNASLSVSASVRLSVKPSRSAVSRLSKQLALSRPQSIAAMLSFAFSHHALIMPSSHHALFRSSLSQLRCHAPRNYCVPIYCKIQSQKSYQHGDFCSLPTPPPSASTGDPNVIGPDGKKSTDRLALSLDLFRVQTGSKFDRTAPLAA